MSWQNPKLDWKTNPHNPIPDDFNRIEGNIDFLKTDIETKKGAIVDALNEVGIAAELTDTHAQLAGKIAAAEKTGIALIPGASDVVIPKGIYDTGGGKVIGDPDLIADNIKQGINIFGVAGDVIPDFLDEDWYAKVPMSSIVGITGYTFPFLYKKVVGKGILVAIYHPSNNNTDYLQVIIDGQVLYNTFPVTDGGSRFFCHRFNSSIEFRYEYAGDYEFPVYVLD